VAGFSNTRVCTHLSRTLVQHHGALRWTDLHQSLSYGLSGGKKASILVLHQLVHHAANWLPTECTNAHSCRKGLTPLKQTISAQLSNPFQKS